MASSFEQPGMDIFLAEITGAGTAIVESGISYTPYAWKEKLENPSSRAYADNNLGRTGTTTVQPAFVVDGGSVGVGDLVLMRLRGRSGVIGNTDTGAGAYRVYDILGRAGTNVPGSGGPGDNLDRRFMGASLLAGPQNFGSGETGSSYPVLWQYEVFDDVAYPFHDFINGAPTATENGYVKIRSAGFYTIGATVAFGNASGANEYLYTGLYAVRRSGPLPHDSYPLAAAGHPLPKDVASGIVVGVGGGITDYFVGGDYLYLNANPLFGRVDVMWARLWIVRQPTPSASTSFGGVGGPAAGGGGGLKPP